MVITPGPEEPGDVAELFRRAERAYAASDWKAAARLFDRVVELDSAGPLRLRARFLGGWSYDNAALHDAAIERYEAVIRDAPDDPLSREARLRAIRLLLYRERWDDAARVADDVIARKDDVGDLGLLVVNGAKALALVRGSEPEQAAAFIERGRTIVERAGLARGGEVPRDVAQIFFALGELRRRRAEQIVLEPPPGDFLGALERRCQLLLDAQAAYSDAMRAYDAHWSAMAGYRVGALYQRLHQDLMNVPRPEEASPGSRARLFEAALRLRYAVLLRKGLAMMDHTLGMSDRTGESSEWIAKAREAKMDLEAGLRETQAAIDAVPYSKKELETALDALRQPAKGMKVDIKRSGVAR